MLALRRTSLSLRPRSASTLTLPYLAREYHGDPGPSSISHRTQQNRALRQATISNGRTAVTADRHVLDTILDAPRPSGTSRDTTGSLHRRPSYAPNAPRTLDKPLRLPTRDDRTEENPYTTSTRLRRMIAKYPDNPTVPVLDQMIALVTEAKPHMVNAPVWNILLGYIGRVRKFEKMWKLYNDMKKRGIKPTSRTYSTMINAYAGISHSSDVLDEITKPIEEKTLSRVTILFEQSQAHLKAQIARQASAIATSDKTELALASRKGEILHEDSLEKAAEQTEKDEEIDLAPVNAYLKFLGRHGLFEEMQKIFVTMDTEGLLSPDSITYTTMFASLYHVHAARTWQQNRGDANVKPVPEIGITARAIWDQCDRQFGRDGEKKRKRNQNANSVDPDREIDNELFIHAIRCFFRGRPEDQRFAQELIQHVWSLPSPGQATVANANANANVSLTSSGAPRIPRHLQTLPQLEPNLHSATALLQMLSSINKPHLATHYTTLFLSNPKLQPAFDQRFLKSAIFAYSETGEIAGLLNILDSYQPSSGSQQWDLLVWRAALQGARWAGDFEAATSLFKRAAQLPDVVEDMHPGLKTTDISRSYEWKTPNGRNRDVRGIPWSKPNPIKPDAQMMTALIKTGMQKSNKDVQVTLNIFNFLGADKTFFVYEVEAEAIPLSELTPDQVHVSGKVIRKKLQYMLVLARTVARAIEKLGAGAVEWRDLKTRVETTLTTWSELVAEQKGSGLRNGGGSATVAGSSRGRVREPSRYRKQASEDARAEGDEREDVPFSGRSKSTRDNTYGRSRADSTAYHPRQSSYGSDRGDTTRLDSRFDSRRNGQNERYGQSFSPRQEQEERSNSSEDGYAERTPFGGNYGSLQRFDRRGSDRGAYEPRERGSGFGHSRGSGSGSGFGFGRGGGSGSSGDRGGRGGSGRGGGFGAPRRTGFGMRKPE